MDWKGRSKKKKSLFAFDMTTWKTERNQLINYYKTNNTINYYNYYRIAVREQKQLLKYRNL